MFLLAIFWATFILLVQYTSKRPKSFAMQWAYVRHVACTLGTLRNNFRDGPPDLSWVAPLKKVIQRWKLVFFIVFPLRNSWWIYHSLLFSRHGGPNGHQRERRQECSSKHHGSSNKSNSNSLAIINLSGSQVITSIFETCWLFACLACGFTAPCTPRLMAHTPSLMFSETSKTWHFPWRRKLFAVAGSRGKRGIHLNTSSPASLKRLKES